jgi:hypothetical protein
MPGDLSDTTRALIATYYADKDTADAAVLAQQQADTALTAATTQDQAAIAATKATADKALASAHAALGAVAADLGLPVPAQARRDYIKPPPLPRK